MMRVVLWWLCTGSLSALPLPPSFLLPDDVVPKKYTIDLTIDPAQPTFEGSARIEIELRNPATVVWLNGKGVNPIDAAIEADGHAIAAHAEAVGGEFIGIEFDSAVGPGRATLSIRYQALLDDKALVGAYRRIVNGEWYVFTTFTAIEARRAFPCFDEPRFKTPWEMTIHTKRGQKAFANTRAVQEMEEAGDMKSVQFAATEPLPSELVAFAVGPFDVFEGSAAGQGTPIRVITPRGHALDGKAAAQATVDVLPRLEAYTGIPYAFGKLDHIALPEGAFGAVENPGLITYIARRLLLPPGQETPDKTRAIRYLEAHEMGHQWFGDLVTQASWEDTWLSEGFANWISDKVMDEEQPPARKHLNTIVERERIMAADAGPHARPVRLAMHNREEMRDVYSPIIYEKGAATLLMLEGWLGEERFRDGLRVYLRIHSFGNATTPDLEATLSGATGVDPTPVMHAFLDQTGIPAVRLGDVQCDTSDVRRFEIEIQESQTWAIPVCWRTDGVIGQSCTVLDTPRKQIELPKGATCPAWIYLNAGGTGYYRTEWTAAQVNLFTEREISALTAAERLTLVYDLRALKRSGRRDVGTLLRKLTEDSEPEIAKAAEQAMQAK
jgi:alanyl aminopeptidase